MPNQKKTTLIDSPNILYKKVRIKRKKKKKINSKKSFKKNMNSSSSSFKIGNNLNQENNLKEEIPNKVNNNEIKYYTDNEINLLTYNQAINIDIRTYFQYYISLIKTKQMIIFAFFTSNDYNSRNLKIGLFLFSFSLYYTVNSLFFQDSTIHYIYEKSGSFDLEYQIPKIMYTTMISSFISFIIRLFSLSEKKVIEAKRNINYIETNNVSKALKIQFALFFALTILFLAFFWYYLSCFCAVYQNAQMTLLKDTLISYGLYMIYPLGISLIPGFFRIPALRDKKQNKNFLYNFSKLIQMI